MENPQPETSAPAVTVEVTGLQTSEVIPQPEIVVIENNTTIEQTPESATAWQERMELHLTRNLEAHQNQSAQMIQAVQQLRETMQLILDCQARTETAVIQLIPKPQSESQSQQQQSEPAPAPAAETITANPEAAQQQPEKTSESARKKRKRL